jgi:hypothetical protein
VLVVVKQAAMLDRAAQVQPEQTQHRAIPDHLGQLVEQAVVIDRGVGWPNIGSHKSF